MTEESRNIPIKGIIKENLEKSAFKTVCKSQFQPWTVVGRYNLNSYDNQKIGQTTTTKLVAFLGPRRNRKQSKSEPPLSWCWSRSPAQICFPAVYSTEAVNWSQHLNATFINCWRLHED